MDEATREAKETECSLVPETICTEVQTNVPRNACNLVETQECTPKVVQECSVQPIQTCTQVSYERPDMSTLDSRSAPRQMLLAMKL